MPFKETHHLFVRIVARHGVALLHQGRQLLRVAFGFEQLSQCQFVPDNTGRASQLPPVMADDLGEWAGHGTSPSQYGVVRV